ncbi:GFA family protein [Pseudohalocynthiibacter aestuariivivens]|uniref:GFA family protein n=1 Tax=Roseovarius pelagicus TaxID=2980108 RepID=A0ABY6D6X0_9RHOB|nr:MULTISPECIES: GFA family protein [Rhodobacterales]QIE46398.1 GFA family protein [Pseudohalocynthiibacter aestuariivivens]UXX81619.1 GFA family protein [Roseovarius pelagicus]
MPKTYQGGCLCGNVRFAAKGPAGNPHTCACKMCQRHSGAPITAWVEFPASCVAWTGPGGAPRLWRSSEISSRAFCPDCGSSLGAVDDAPVVALLLGCFDQAGRAELAPQSQSFRARAPKWVHVDQAPKSQTA